MECKTGKKPKRKYTCMHRYTPEELRFLKNKIAGRSYMDMTELFNKKFDLSVTVAQMKATLIRYHFRNGRDTRLQEKIPPGTEQVKGGYVCVKINPYFWKSKHALIWEAANGPIPKGYMVIFADGNKSNYDLDNLVLVSRGEVATMNRFGLFHPDKDLTKAGKIIADIRMAITKRKRGVKA